MKETQLKVDALTLENKRLKIQGASTQPTKKVAKGNNLNAHPSTSEIPSISASSEKSLIPDSGLDTNSHRLTTSAASKFSVMNELFIQPNVFLMARPKHTTLHRRPERYATSDSNQIAVVAELYDELIEDLHALLESNVEFRKTVCDLSIGTSKHSDFFYSVHQCIQCQPTTNYPYSEEQTHGRYYIW